MMGLIATIASWWDDVRFWWKENFAWPFANFILDHFNWLPYDIEGQMFRRDDGLEIIWNGEYNKSRSFVKSTDRGIFGQFEGLPDGTVFICNYIWGCDGTLKNIRDVRVLLWGEELRRSIVDGTPIPPSCFMKDSLLEYQERYKHETVVQGK